MGGHEYWIGRVRKFRETVQEHCDLAQTSSPNPDYEPQFQFNLSTYHGRLILFLYSSGAPIRELAQHFGGLLAAWELSNRLSDQVCKEHHLQTCRDWDFSLSNLNHYNWCFWLVGLGLCLGISEDQWQRLLALVGGEGEDVLLDRVIASRSPARRIGSALLHAKPYARLLKALDAPKDQQAALLAAFVDHWYSELKRTAPRSRKAPAVQPFWYIWGDPDKHPLEMGSYFGRWCIEAAAAVKAFGLDDSLCLGDEHYPGDLLRPDGPSTHPVRVEPKTSWLQRILGKKTT
nr:PoNe immunity protein domain-containing protein [Limnohabitans sp. DM1]